MPREITPEREKEMNELFELYDKDGSGAVDVAELATLLRALGLAPSNAQVKEVMTKYDKDNSGELSKDEFRQLYCDDSLPEASDNIDAKAMFNAFDADGSGSVSRAELTEALSQMGEPMSKDDIDAMFANAGMADKTQLDFEEFKKVVLGEGEAAEEVEAKPETKTSKREIWKTLESKLPSERKNAEQRAQRKELFSQFDPNGNGYLSLAEVDAGARKIWKLDELTDDLPPILMRAFTAAKTVRQRAGKQRKNDDDYVQRAEFRMLMAYIKMYFELWVMFDEVDGSDDRRVDLEEFKKSLPQLESFGVKINDAEEEFKVIDKNGGGIILFVEFSEWACEKGLDADGEGSDTDLETATQAGEAPKEPEAKPEEEKPAAAKKSGAAQREQWDKIKTQFPADRSEESKAKRKELFSAFDPNGNGYLSLAEVDKGVRENMSLHEMTDDLAPILMRAFTSAKDVASRKGKRKNDDDYVQKSEFRMLMAYIQMYFELWVMFDEVDGSDDRRVDLEEFKKALPQLESFGVKIDEANAEEEFKKVDTNGGGIILFREFASWACEKSLDADGEDETDLDPK